MLVPPSAWLAGYSLLGLMRPDTRLPIVELHENAKHAVASALAAIADEVLTELTEI
jgi:4-hydroxy-tetrahydrodipicolinate synthase